MADTNASRIKRSLWSSFVSTAQPYFFPVIRGSAWITLLLMIALLIFLFGLLSDRLAVQPLLLHHGLQVSAGGFALYAFRVAKGATALSPD
jgi:hypothetical protein